MTHQVVDGNVAACVVVHVELSSAADRSTVGVTWPSHEVEDLLYVVDVDVGVVHH